MKYNAKYGDKYMIKTLKNLFAKNQEKEVLPDPPGRTFKRVLTGRYFGCEDMNADDNSIAKAKKEKIAQIKEWELLPVFVKFAYDPALPENNHPVYAHVAFQKEVLAEKWNMVHVTEISFTVYHADFEEFEAMSGVSLAKDFKDLTEVTFGGKERRIEKR